MQEINNWPKPQTKPPQFDNCVSADTLGASEMIRCGGAHFVPTKATQVILI